MRIPFLLFTILICACYANGEDLQIFGPLPDLPKAWSLREKSALPGAPVRWSWVVFTNSQNGDLLSFAAHKKGTQEPRELINWSDTAHEIFPGGLPKWTQQGAFAKHPIRNRIVRVSQAHEALEYTFIEEDRTNHLAHGFALFFDDLVVFVQNTSTSAITPDLAREMASSLNLKSHTGD